MFIALRDIRFAKGRFALMGTVIGLISVLTVLLVGLAEGLVDDGIAGLRELPATHIAFDDDAGVSFSRSVVDRADWEAAADTPTVDAATPFGNSLFNGRTDRGVAVDVALFGVEPGSFLAPPVVTGDPLSDGPGIVITASIADEGVEVGDVILLDRVDEAMPVVGITEPGTFGHVPVAYATLEVWQQATFGADPDAGDLASSVAIQADDLDAAALDAEHGWLTVTKEDAYGASPGYTEETATMTMIRTFIYIISALLVGAFFVVWTIQRRGEIGLLKALGASNRYLLRDALGQLAIVLVSASFAGLTVGWLLGLAVGDAVPFILRPAPVLTAIGLLITVGLAGAAAAVRRITEVDPLIALGGAR